MENATMKISRKIPIQIYLEPEQARIISLLSKSSGKSKAAIIRSCISKFIDTIPPEKDPALNIMNLGASGKKDIAKRHDDYLISYKN
jgi:predicted DNA-binding protein